MQEFLSLQKVLVLVPLNPYQYRTLLTYHEHKAKTDKKHDAKNNGELLERHHLKADS